MQFDNNYISLNDEYGSMLSNDIQVASSETSVFREEINFTANVQIRSVIDDDQVTQLNHSRGLPLSL